MQCTDFVPPYYNSRCWNVSGGGPWPLFNNENVWFSGKDCDLLLPPSSAVQYLGSNKDILRQTILKHEITFREQVKELHRLYGRQRELMFQTQNTELPCNHLQKQMSHSSLSSQKQFNSSGKTVENPHPLMVNPASREPSVMSAENSQTPSNFLLGKDVQCSTAFSVPTRSSEERKLFPSKGKKPRKVLDLELPAEEYLDYEEEEWSREEKVAELPDIPDPPPEEISYFQVPGLCKSNSVNEAGLSSLNSTYGKSQLLIDLNEPPQLDESVAVSSSILLTSDTNRMEEIVSQDKDIHEKSTSESHLFGDQIVHDLQARKHIGGSSKVLCPKDMQPDQLVDSLGAAIDAEKMNHPLQHCPPTKLGDTAAQQPALDSKVSGKAHDTCDVDNPTMSSSSISASCKLSPRPDQVKIEASSSASSRRKPKRTLRQMPKIPVVHALPCFDVTGISGTTLHKLLSSSDLARSRSAESVSSHLTCRHNKTIDCGKCCKVSQPVNAVEEEHMTNIGQMEVEVLEQRSSFAGGKTDTDDKTFGPSSSIALPDGILMPTGSISNQSEGKSIKDSKRPENFDGYPTTKSTEHFFDDITPHQGIENQCLRCKCHVDLNSCISEHKQPLETSVPGLVESMGVASEAAARSRNKTPYNLRVRSDEKQLKAPLRLKQKDRDLEGECERRAAETIVSIVSLGLNPIAAATGPPGSSFDRLNWFAGVVTSHADEEEDGLHTTTAAGSSYDELPDGMHRHEASPPKLREKRLKRIPAETPVQKEKDTADIVSSRPRRGQARRTRQQNDVQFDDLQVDGPTSLASLAQYKVAKELHAEEDKVVAEDALSGKGPGRRKVGRKCGAARGKLSNASLTDTSVSSAVKQHSEDGNSVSSDGSSTGWWKSIRRRRDRRTRACNYSLMASFPAWINEGK